MRIIVMTNRFGDLGTHPQLTSLALYLKYAGHDVRAISLAPPGSIAQRFADAGIGMEVIDSSRRGSFIPVVARLATHFRRFRAEAVIAFLYETIIPARFAARLGGVQSVISSIRNEYFGPRYRELLIRITDPLSVVTVVNSQRVAHSLVRRGIASPRRLRVIHNGIDTSLFRPSSEAREAIREALGIASGEFLWLSVGRLREQKAYPTLLQAFSEVVGMVPGSKLIVAGRGPMRAALEDGIRRLGLQEAASLVGYRNDVPELLSAADAFVMASRYEGMPNAVMQALAAELPVVGTNVGGMPELIRDQENGYLVDPGDPAVLARAMSRLSLASADERRQMGNRGRAHIEEQFDLGRMMDKWLKLTEESTRGSVSR